MEQPPGHTLSHDDLKTNESTTLFTHKHSMANIDTIHTPYALRPCFLPYQTPKTALEKSHRPKLHCLLRLLQRGAPATKGAQLFSTRKKHGEKHSLEGHEAGTHCAAQDHRRGTGK